MTQAVRCLQGVCWNVWEQLRLALFHHRLLDGSVYSLATCHCHAMVVRRRSVAGTAMDRFRRYFLLGILTWMSTLLSPKTHGRLRPVVARHVGIPWLDSLCRFASYHSSWWPTFRCPTVAKTIVENFRCHNEPPLVANPSSTTRCRSPPRSDPGVAGRAGSGIVVLWSASHSVLE